MSGALAVRHALSDPDVRTALGERRYLIVSCRRVIDEQTAAIVLARPKSVGLLSTSFSAFLPT